MLYNCLLVVVALHYPQCKNHKVIDEDIIELNFIMLHQSCLTPFFSKVLGVLI